MTSHILPLPRRFLAFFRALYSREKWLNSFGLAIVLVSLLTGTVTYALVSEKTFLINRSSHLYHLIILDVMLLVALACVVGWRTWRVWKRSRQKLAGALLHVQLTAAFSMLAAIPAILVAIFAVAFVHISMQAWFGPQIHTAVTESQAIAQSYLQEHQQNIRADMLAMAGDLNRESVRLNSNPRFLQEYFKTQAYLRNLSEALLVDSSGDVIARAGISLSIELLPPDFTEMLKRAEKGEPVLFVGENGDRVRALVKLDNLIDTYLFVGRIVDEKVLTHVTMTKNAADAYADLEAKQAKLKLTMTLIFALVALMLLLVAVWAGLTLAERIISPVSRLIQASERVRAGDLNTRVDEERSDNEIGTLARAFNKMIDQLGSQRRDLLNANRLLDERRRFSETVLAGVNAGILGLDAQGVIQIVNTSAEKLLRQTSTTLQGQKLMDICPEMETIRRVLRSKSMRNIETPIEVEHSTGEVSHWIVRMTAEMQDDTIRGYVATFDDLSPLIDAQRKAAWADVARRVAHEIKNPLTPIQLSAERLRKRYSKQITEDVETFDSCTNTIIRHVDDIRRMVDEFSAFARMPTANKQNENLVTICQQVIVLFQQAHGQVRFIFDRPEKPVNLAVDRQQISQALTNVIKNAYEAIGDKEGGEVRLTVSETDKDVRLSVSDNGCGWPAELLPRLTDPYVTTKASGTGLGLAIVAKIVEDHHGHLEFKNNSPHGAVVHLILPKTGETRNG